MFLKIRKKPKDLGLLWIVLILSTPYFSLDLTQMGFLALLPFVREEFVLTRIQVGLYSTCFFLGSTMIAIFTGALVDKLREKKSILLGIGCFQFTMLLHGLFFSYGVLMFLSFIAGMSMSIMTPSINKAILLATPPEKRAVSMGIVESGGGFGAIVGASLLPILGKNFGWRMAIQFSAVFALLIGILVCKFYQEQNKSSSILDNRKSQREKQPSFKNSILALFVNKQLLRLSVIGIVLGASVGAVNSQFAIFFV